MHHLLFYQLHPNIVFAYSLYFQTNKNNFKESFMATCYLASTKTLVKKIIVQINFVLLNITKNKIVSNKYVTNQ